MTTKHADFMRLLINEVREQEAKRRVLEEKIAERQKIAKSILRKQNQFINLDVAHGYNVFFTTDSCRIYCKNPLPLPWMLVPLSLSINHIDESEITCSFTDENGHQGKVTVPLESLFISVREFATLTRHAIAVTKKDICMNALPYENKLLEGFRKSYEQANEQVEHIETISHRISEADQKLYDLITPARKRAYGIRN